METKTKSVGEWRKEVYDLLDSFGFKLKRSQQQELSQLLQSVYEHREVVRVLEKMPPMEHELICPLCLKKEVGLGKKSVFNRLTKLRKIGYFKENFKDQRNEGN